MGQTLTTESSCLCCFLSSKAKHSLNAPPSICPLSLVQCFVRRAHGPKVHPAQCLLPTCRNSRALGTELASRDASVILPFPSVQQPSAQGPPELPMAFAFKIPEETFLPELIQSLLWPCKLWHLLEHFKRVLFEDVPHVWFDLSEFHLLPWLRDTEQSLLIHHFYAPL